MAGEAMSVSGSEKARMSQHGDSEWDFMGARVRILFVAFTCVTIAKAFKGALARSKS
jgi:hypothetical protein